MYVDTNNMPALNTSYAKVILQDFATLLQFELMNSEKTVRFVPAGVRRRYRHSLFTVFRQKFQTRKVGVRHFPPSTNLNHGLFQWPYMFLRCVIRIAECSPPPFHFRREYYKHPTFWGTLASSTVAECNPTYHLSTLAMTDVCYRYIGAFHERQ